MQWKKGECRVGPETRWEMIACPVCGGQAFDRLFEKRGEPFARCRACGLVLINPRPVHAHVQGTYTPGYSQGYVAKMDGKRRRSRRLVAAVRRHGPRSGRWLDVGCSAGFVVEAARDAGYEAYGVDVEAWGVSFARDTLGLTHVAQGTLEEQHYPAGFFSVISAYDVLEHVPDLAAFLRETARILAPVGVLEIVTPDVGHWRVPRRLETWAAILPSEHLYYFDRRTLARVLAQNGLRVLCRRRSLKPRLKVRAGRA